MSLNTVENAGNFLIEAVGDVNIFTDEEELQFGRAYVAQHEKQVKLYTDSVVTNYINTLGQSLVRFPKSQTATWALKKRSNGSLADKRRESVSRETISAERKFKLTADEREQWNENGYFIRYDVFTEEENNFLAQIADDIAVGKRPFPAKNVHPNALVRDGKVEASGPNAMHAIHHINHYSPEFLEHTRDPRLTDPVVDLIGPNILGLNNLYIWKPPKIGLGFPWHQDKWYFNHQYITTKTVGTWTAIDTADVENGCLYVIPGSHKEGVQQHDELEGSQQNEFKIVQSAKDEDGVAVEVPPGTVVFFNNELLHKSMDNHSSRFRRCNVAHYISADSARVPQRNVQNVRPVMWVQGGTYSEEMEPVCRDALPIPEEKENRWAPIHHP